MPPPLVVIARSLEAVRGGVELVIVDSIAEGLFAYPAIVLEYAPVLALEELVAYLRDQERGTMRNRL